MTTAVISLTGTCWRAIDYVNRARGGSDVSWASYRRADHGLHSTAWLVQNDFLDVLQNSSQGFVKAVHERIARNGVNDPDAMVRLAHRGEMAVASYDYQVRDHLRVAGPMGQAPSRLTQRITGLTFEFLREMQRQGQIDMWHAGQHLEFLPASYNLIGIKVALTQKGKTLISRKVG